MSLSMNQPTISNLIGMIIAQKCGIEEPVFDAAVRRSYDTIEHVVGKGGFSYGSGGSNPGYFNNNGTSGSLAIAFALLNNKVGTAFYAAMSAAESTAGIWSFGNDGHMKKLRSNTRSRRAVCCTFSSSRPEPTTRIRIPTSR